MSSPSEGSQRGGIRLFLASDSWSGDSDSESSSESISPPMVNSNAVTSVGSADVNAAPVVKEATPEEAARFMRRKRLLWRVLQKDLPPPPSREEVRFGNRFKGTVGGMVLAGLGKRSVNKTGGQGSNGESAVMKSARDFPNVMSRDEVQEFLDLHKELVGEGVHFEIPGPLDRADRAPFGYYTVYCALVESWMSIPPQRFLCELIDFLGICPGQLTPSAVSCVLAFCILCDSRGIGSSVELFMRLFSFQRYPYATGWFYFRQRPGVELLAYRRTAVADWKKRYFYVRNPKNKVLPRDFVSEPKGLLLELSVAMQDQAEDVVMRNAKRLLVLGEFIVEDVVTREGLRAIGLVGDQPEVPRVSSDRQVRGALMRNLLGKRRRDDGGDVGRPSMGASGRKDGVVVNNAGEVVKGRLSPNVVRSSVVSEGPRPNVVDKGKEIANASNEAVDGVSSVPDVVRRVRIATEVQAERGKEPSLPDEGGMRPAGLPKVSIVEDVAGYNVLKCPFRPGASVLEDRVVAAYQIKEVRLPADRETTGDASTQDVMLNALHHVAGCGTWMAEVMERMISNEKRCQELERQNAALRNDVNRRVNVKVAEQMAKLEAQYAQDKLRVEDEEKKFAVEKSVLELSVRRLEADLSEQNRASAVKYRGLWEKLLASEDALKVSESRLEKMEIDLGKARSEVAMANAEREKMSSLVAISEQEMCKLQTEVELLKGEVCNAAEASRSRHITEYKESPEFTRSLLGMLDECSERGFYMFKRALKHWCPSVLDLDHLCWSEETLNLCEGLPLAPGEPLWACSPTEDVSASQPNEVEKENVEADKSD